MINISPAKILAIGMILMLNGVILPFLMVIRVLESTLLMNFIAFALQVAGLFMGTIGVVFYARMNKQ